MKIAILSDPHGNSTALDAVLEDIERSGGVDGYWILGDLCMLGSDPVGVLKRLQALPNAQFVRGNTDSWLVGERQFFPDDPASLEPKAFEARLALTNTLAWTRGMITASGHYDWLMQLPLEWRTTLPDGTRVLCVHAAPGTDDGPGFHPAHSDTDMAAQAAEANADLLLVGHTHWPMSRKFGDVHVINASPVNIQSAPDFRAKYCLLEATTHACKVAFRYVTYDREREIAALDAIHHPARDYIANMLRNGLTAFTGGLEGDLSRLIPNEGLAYSRGTV